MKRIFQIWYRVLFGVPGRLRVFDGKGGGGSNGVSDARSDYRGDRSRKLIVTSDTIIRGEVYTDHAEIYGRLDGRLTASGKVVLEDHSVFVGELKAKTLVVKELASGDFEVRVTGKNDHKDLSFEGAGRNEMTPHQAGNS
jgi:hypothetical protein